MTRDQFEAEFGPLEGWKFSNQWNDIEGCCNRQRAQELPDSEPFLRGRLTNWGWLLADELLEGEDWESRASALRVANELHQVAEKAGLQRQSEAAVPFVPFVCRWHSGGADFLSNLKSSAGMAVDEMAEIEKLDTPEEPLPAIEKLAYEIFLGGDTLLDGLDAYFDEAEVAAYLEIARRMDERLEDSCHVRFDIYERDQRGRYVVSPEYWVGRTSGYLAGLWSYEVRT